MNAICRFVTSANLRVCGAFLLHIVFAIALLTLPATGARAMTQEEAVDFAVGAGLKVLAATTGVSLPPEAVLLLKEMVACGTKGGDVGDCAKQAAVKVALKDAPGPVKEIAGCFVGGGDARACVTQAGIKQLPPEARPVVQCLADGGNVAGCAAKAAIGELMARVPEGEARDLVQCVAGGGSAAQCGAQAAAANLPAGSEAQRVAQCVAGGGNAGDCAQQIGTQIVNQATSQAMNQAVEHMKQLRGEEDRLDPSNATVNNIVTLAKGIDQGRVDLIIVGGGPELAKIVLTAIITAIVPPAGLIAGPVIGALVDLYGTTGRVLLDKLMKLFKGEGEISDIGEILFQFYFQEIIARPCALLPGGLKDTICGGLADVIAAAAGVFGDAIDVVVKIVEGILKYTGASAVLGWLGDRWDDLFGDGLEDPKVCGSPQEYFAKNHLPCLAAAVGASAGSAPSLTGGCIANFKRCHKDPGSMCANLDKALADQAKQIYDALEEGARTYSPAVGAFIHGRRKQICQHGFENNLETDATTIRLDFSTQCASALSTQRPLNPNTCGDGKQRNPTAAHRNACYNALSNGNLQQLTGKTLQELIAETCKAYCAEDRNNCPPSFKPAPCVHVRPQTVEAFGFVYVPTESQVFQALFNWCRIKPWSIFDRIDRVIHWPDKIDSIVDRRPGDDRIWMNYTPSQVVNLTQTPKWAVSNLDAVVDRPLARLAVGSCSSSRTMLSPVAAWSSTRTSSSLLRDSPKDFSQIMQVAMTSPPPALKLQLSVKSVALVTGGFNSCSGMGMLASRGSSGSDRSFTPPSTAVTPGRGGTTVRSTPTQPRGSSGFDTSRSPAIERLTGDGLGGGVSSGYRLPDTSRGPMPGGAAATRGSSGASSAKPSSSSQSSSGFDMSSSGTSVPRSQGSSGASSVQSTGTSVPRSGAGDVLRTNRPSKIEIFRQQQQPPPSDAYRYRVN